MKSEFYDISLIPEVKHYEGEPDPIVEKVLLDIYGYSELPKRIHIGDELWHYAEGRIWKPFKGEHPFVTDDDLYYDKDGEYVNDGDFLP